MKKVFLIPVCFIIVFTVSYSQTFTTNDTPVGLEHNVLFNADKGRFQVTQTGQAQVDLNYLFDGRFLPTYSSSPVSSSDPTVITISGLPPTMYKEEPGWAGQQDIGPLKNSR